MTERYEKLEDLREKLEEYCEVENDEHGEYVRGLCQVSNYSYCMDNEFMDALIKVMGYELENYCEHCVIVETEETYTREYKELEWQ